MSDSIYYVYVLCDPNDDFEDIEIGCTKKPFYVGKGKGPRAAKHLAGQSHKNQYLKNKIAKIKETGNEPVIVFAGANLDQETAFGLEKQLIAKYGRKVYDENGILVNLAHGGKGGSGGVKLSITTRNRMSLAKQNMTPEHKEKISKNHRFNKRCKLKNPNGDEIVVEGLTKFCKENGLDYQSIRNSLRFKKPVRNGLSLGWTLLEFLD